MIWQIWQHEMKVLGLGEIFTPRKTRRGDAGRRDPGRAEARLDRGTGGSRPPARIWRRGDAGEALVSSGEQGRAAGADLAPGRPDPGAGRRFGRRGSPAGGAQNGRRRRVAGRVGGRSWAAPAGGAAGSGTGHPWASGGARFGPRGPDTGRAGWRRRAEEEATWHDVVGCGRRRDPSGAGRTCPAARGRGRLGFIREISGGGANI